MVSTGDTLLSDSGRLEYNTVTFSVLYRSEINGEAVPDDAGRTIKGVKYLLTAEGIVSAAQGVPLETNFVKLRQLLSQQGGTLIYKGRGFGNLVVNPPGGAGAGVRDLAWGPIPKVLFFQPLGNGFSAICRWQCEFMLSEYPPFSPTVAPNTTALPTNPMQFSYDVSVSYDEECYSSVTLRGIIEVPLSRFTVLSREIPQNTVDAYRRAWEDILFDLTKFRVVDRNFTVSPDKRTCKWMYRVEELPPMDLPPFATKARGVMDVQPIKLGGQRSPLLLGNMWSCTLRGSYSIRKDFPRQKAWGDFFMLLLWRMRSSELGQWPDNVNPNAPQQPPGRPINPGIRGFFGFFGGGIIQTVAQQIQGGPPGEFIRGGIDLSGAAAPGNRRGQALLTDFRFSEPLYLDSRSMTFEATWTLFVTFRTLLDATGVWTWPPEGLSAPIVGEIIPTWRSTVQNISGWRSWLTNQIDPFAEVIVDMGGGSPPTSSPLLLNVGNQF